MTGTGPFRGFIPYDEGAAGLFFGRAAEIEALFRLVVREGALTTAVTGAQGVGKTSLLRAGLIARLTKQGVLAIYLPGDAPFDQEFLPAAARAGAEPPTANETAGDYLIRIARTARSGSVLILDHLERLLGADAPPPDLLDILSRAAVAAGPRLRFVLSVQTGSFHRLDRMTRGHALPPPANWYEVPRLLPDQLSQIVEQTALQTGTFFETGLASVIAADLCRDGSCLPLDFQLVVRAALDQRLTTVRRYERAGGALLLIPEWLDRACHDAGGLLGRRLLQAVTVGHELSADELTTNLGSTRAAVDQALSVLTSRGILRKRALDRGERFALSHPALGPHIESLCALDGARAAQARQRVRRATLAGDRLSLREIAAARRYLGAAVTTDESTTLRRSLRRNILKLTSITAVVAAAAIAMTIDMKRSFTLGLDPADGSPSARVVVRKGRNRLPLVGGLMRGETLADTGFSAAGLAPDVASRISQGAIAGALERPGTTAVPTWLRAVLDGLRPVPRGMALVLLGDPGGITSLKQGFADPATRREALESLAVIGTGRAGEDEILAAALSDASPEVRRRGVEVAASIDRRLGKGSHGTTLRSALKDPSFDVKQSVLRECETLPPAEVAEILSVALGDQEPRLRREAEKAVTALGARAPKAAAEAVRAALRSPNAQARKTALQLLEQVGATAASEITATLGDVLADESASEEVRIAVLGQLRRAGKPDPSLKTVLEKAVRAPESSPRLKAAALPLFARLIDPAEAETMALADGKGSPAQRAAAAAVWGAVAAQRPEAATKALKAALYDPSAEVRVEAARSYGALKREGPALVQRILLDPNAEVMRAALDAAVELAPAQPYLVAEALGRAFKNVRPGLRRFVVEALGRIGRERPAPVVPPLARALKEGDVPSRTAAASALCGMARKAPEAVTPYLRLAARDPDRDVRSAAAACLPELGAADPKAAARLASELGSSEEPAVRAAAAHALGGLSGGARDQAVGPLLKLLLDSDRAVRMAAAISLRSFGGKTAEAKVNDEIEKALGTFMLQGDAEERRLAVESGADLGLLSLVKQGAGDPDEGVRLESVKRAAAAGTVGRQVLEGAVADRSSLVRAAAVRHLATSQGESARQVIPVFQAMLQSSDPATRRAGITALGEIADAADDATRILSELLTQRSESMRAAAAVALGHLADRNANASTRALEQALLDPAHDVRSAAIAGLGAAWSRRRSPADLGQILGASETESARRQVAVEALVAQAGSDKRDAALQALALVAKTGQPLGRLFAQVGRAFIEAKAGDLHGFLEKLLGG